MPIKASIDRLYDDVLTLTAIDPPRNYREIESLDAIAGYIHHEFSKLPFDEVSYQPFMAAGQTYKNVCAVIHGSSPERIVLGAHYDVDGEQPGADDNASAVAGMLELDFLDFLLSEAKSRLRDLIKQHQVHEHL